MYIKQKELLAGLDKKFIKEIIDLTEKKLPHLFEALTSFRNPIDQLYPVVIHKING